MAANRAGGVAPVCIHCFSDWVAASDSSNRFRNYKFVWNFDDSGSGTWTNSGKSKNIEYGAAAAHVYESAGVYTITLTVYEWSGGSQVAVPAAAESIEITVTDPDTVYAGTLTTCVNPSGDSDFTGKPSGAAEVQTDDLSTVTQYADAGERVLFKRGASWTSSGISWPNNGGPVTIGAYGSGNDPQITMTGEYFLYLDYKQDWRVMDLHLKDATNTYLGIYGLINIQRNLFLRLTTEGFHRPLHWSNWNVDPPMMKEDIAVVECDLSGMNSYALFGGSEHLAVLGNTFADSQNSHVCRPTMVWRGIIAHNDMSGADVLGGDLAVLKFQSPATSQVVPSPSPSTNQHRHYSQYSTISDNTFGRGGGWPVNIAPQDNVTDEDIDNIIFERNRVVSDHGTESGVYVLIGLRWASVIDGTVRNNILDGKGSVDRAYTGIDITKMDAAPAPSGNEIYNNTIYNPETTIWDFIGIHVAATATGTVIRNNLASFPNETSEYMIDDDSADLVESNNLLTDTPNFVDPDNATPLSRDFDIRDDSPAVNYGTNVNVYLDFEENNMIWNSFEAGAFQQGVETDFNVSQVIRFG